MTLLGILTRPTVTQLKTNALAAVGTQPLVQRRLICRTHSDIWREFELISDFLLIIENARTIFTAGKILLDETG